MAKDQQRKDTFRGLLQESIIRYAEIILALDEMATLMKDEWKVKPDVDKPIKFVSLEKTEASWGLGLPERARDTNSVNTTKQAATDNERIDSFKQNSVWSDGGVKLTVIERRGETFRARLECNEWARNIKGSIKDGQVTWLAKDVQPITGGVGGDNYGTI
jgi:hypothetical protein